ncbi:GGDEF domain-containing protein [Pseudocolwellia agarivorans]|uniref:GGDEF domain-containing protein n=1 Tax=Pseudocolwellia agarivorans TaxID=1911682 RepID=UPI0009869B3C|nr:GGDEF domain-containing protein [Pseudocolwellia agarivorans]
MIKQESYDYRRFALRILLVVTIFSATFFAIKNWISGWYSFAIMEGVIALFWLYILSIVSTTKHLERWSFIYLCTFYSLVLYGIYFTNYRSGLFAWLFIFPIISYLLLGRKVGTILTAISVFVGLGFLGRLVFQMNSDIHWIVMGNFGLCVIAIWSMVYVYESKSEAVIARLKEQVTRDPLTGLLNVRNLNDILVSVLYSAERRGESVTIAYIDLNDFKKINDTQGHQKGNEILLSVANTIKSITRAEDHSFRYGGDEFCIVFPNCTLEQAKNSYGQRLLENVHNELDQLTMSIGYAQTGPEAYLSPDDFIHQADKSMYAEKCAFKTKTS